MADTNDIEITGYQALAEFRYQIRRFLRFSEEAARQAGLEPQHHQLMLAIKGASENAERRIVDLAEHLQIQHHSAVELVDRLVKRGLIRRTRGNKDRREVQVNLTPRGERILKQLTLHHREELRTLAPALVSALKRVTAIRRDGHKIPGKKRAAAARTERRSSR